MGMLKLKVDELQKEKEEITERLNFLNLMMSTREEEVEVRLSKSFGTFVIKESHFKDGFLISEEKRLIERLKVIEGASRKAYDILEEETKQN